MGGVTQAQAGYKASVIGNAGGATTWKRNTVLAGTVDGATVTATADSSTYRRLIVMSQVFEIRNVSPPILGRQLRPGGDVESGADTLYLAEGRDGMFRVSLAQAPTATVTGRVTITAGGTHASITEGATLSFTPTSYKGLRIMLKGTEDSATTAEDTVTVRVATTSNDSRYHNRNYDLNAKVVDNDNTSAITISVSDTTAMIREGESRVVFRLEANRRLPGPIPGGAFRIVGESVAKDIRDNPIYKLDDAWSSLTQPWYGYYTIGDFEEGQNTADVTVQFKDDNLPEKDHDFKLTVSASPLTIPGFNYSMHGSDNVVTLTRVDDDHNRIITLTPGIEFQRGLDVDSVRVFYIYDGTLLITKNITRGEDPITYLGDLPVSMSRITRIFINLGDTGDYGGRFKQGPGCIVSVPETATSIPTSVRNSPAICRPNQQMPYISAGFPSSATLADTPEITIGANASTVNEGDGAAFTLRADPAPLNDLTVNLYRSERVGSGLDELNFEGAKTFTIPAGQTLTTYTYDTHDDDKDLGGGTIRVTVKPGQYYTVGTANSGTTAILDDEDPNFDDSASDSDSNSPSDGDPQSESTSVPATPAPFVPDATVVADVRSYAGETHRGTVHVNRWKQVLVGLGVETYPGITAMTSTEAKTYADQGWTRWDPVVTELKRAEDHAAAQSQQPAPAVVATPEISIAGGNDVTEGSSATFTLTASPAPSADLSVSVTVSASGDYGVTTGSKTVTIGTSGTATLNVATTDDSTDENDGGVTATLATGTGYTVSTSSGSATVSVADNDDPPAFVADATIVANVRSYVAETHRGTVHVNRWKQVLVGLGVETYPGITAMTSTEAKTYADQGWTRWDTVVTELKKAEDFAAAQVGPPQPQKVAPVVVTPEVSIAGGSGVTEGSSATFTLTASPAPSADLSVSVTVSASGDYGVTTGSKTVTIGTGGTATLTVPTTGDSTDEADGSVTATLATGTGYTVSTSKNAATVSVADDDAAPVITPEVSIAGGSGVTEGSSATFTLTASPAPSADLSVSVTVSASGDYGVSAGSKTVTIGTGGTATLTVPTTGDSTDEADGSVTATLATGTGYTVSTSKKAATVSVADDDDAPVITPEISIAGGNGVTEGGSATFTLTASPAPSADLSVSVTVSASGDYGVSAGSKTVTIGTGGTATLTVPTTGDSTDEADGSVTATLATGSGYTVSTSKKAATVSVADDDAAPPDATPDQSGTLEERLQAALDAGISDAGVRSYVTFALYVVRGDALYTYLFEGATPTVSLFFDQWTRKGYGDIVGLLQEVVDHLAS